MMQEYDVLIIGALVGTDIIMAEHLSRKGLNVVVARYKGRESRSIEVPSGYLRAFDTNKIVAVTPGFEFWQLTRKSKLILSITGTLVPYMGKLLWPFHRFLRLPPVINLSTGSDMTELAVEKSLRGAAHRQYLRFVSLNWLLPLPHSIINAVNLNLSNVVFMACFPYLLPINLDIDKNIGKVSNPRLSKNTLRLFHCSNIDWSYSNFKPSRNSTKGNDKFLKAFIEAVQNGVNVHLIILDRGSDSKIAREMIVRAGVESSVTWKGNLSREELYAEMRRADVVVNMFAHGGAGGISYEAMSLGRPVMQYADPNFFDLLYGGTPPPFINCRTKEEILGKIVWAAQTKSLPEIGRRSQAWVTQHVDPERTLTKFLFYYSLLTGELKFDPSVHIRDTDTHVNEMLSGNYDPFDNL